ncbi:MAG: hypothetical protein U0R71_13660 [Solirubrobacterales bacterium]
MRSAIGATIALCVAALLTLAAGTAAAAPVPRATIAWVPAGTTVRQLAAAGFSPGLMSAGLGTVPPQQTYLDIGQGNRVFDSLYDEPLPPLSGSCARWAGEVDSRAASAPAEIVPRLLAATLRGAGVGVEARGASRCALGPSGPGGRGHLLIADGTLAAARDAAAANRLTQPAALLIAIARPTGKDDAPLAIGIAGRGFEGNLTSDSTRTDGYVLSTDVAPTILAWFGLDVPSQMSGQPIRSRGAVDVGAIDSLGARMAVISHRRGPVIGWSLLVWLGLLALAVAAARLGDRPALARAGVRVVGLAVVYMPLVMLAGAALEPGETAEVLLVMAAAPALAGLTLAALRGYRALAAAAGLTVLAYAVDVVVGSPLTSLSLLGPNPGLGVRFYGIGNELEALLAVLLVAGTGAALAGFLPALPRTGAAAAFLATGLLGAVVFAAGRFGADVGAAIVLPVGAVVAALLLTGASRRAVVLVVAAPLAVLALLALIDLVSGANAHLTRSVLDAGGLHALGDVAQRRLQLSVHSFGRPVLLYLLPLVVALAALAVYRRDRLRAWTAASPAYAAGLAGAVAATAAGTLANDSGALLLVVGTAYLLVFAGFAWAERDRAQPH